MSKRSVLIASALLLAASAAPGALAQQAPQGAHPRDLTGVWTNANKTPVSRPRNQPKLVVSAEEAKRIADGAAIAGVAPSEAGLVDKIDPNAPAPAKGSADFGTKGYNSFWLSTGDSLAKVKGEYRTSNIVDPPDGQIPHKDPAAVMKKAREGGIVYLTGVAPYNGPEEIGLAERCLIGFSGAAGPGMFTPIYNNNYQFVLTNDYFVIEAELVHDARIIPIYASAAEARAHHRPNAIKPWLGDSVAWWDGDSLTVESINLNPTQSEQGVIPLSPQGKVTEHFQRWADDEIFYSFTVEDPVRYSKPWTVENSFRPQSRLYEYACHEGNYAMEGILSGARKLEREQAAAKATNAKATKAPH